MTSKTVTVESSVGLHARPAAQIAQAAADYDKEITLTIPGKPPADAASSLMIMMLGATHGDTITVASDDPAAVDVITAMISTDLDAA
ncbi:UNVERIFIED_ORG: phosphocarrier protein [Arthrobacter sp. UYEF10]